MLSRSFLRVRLISDFTDINALRRPFPAGHAHEIIDVEITQEDGLFYATSPDLPEILLAHQDRDVLVSEVQPVIQAIYKRRTGDSGAAVTRGRSTDTRS